jgi:uncharacterized protein YegL
MTPTIEKIGCGFCPADFNTERELLDHAQEKHPEKLRRPRKDGKQSVLVNVILDKSGSMAAKVHDTIGGFNTYIEELKKEPSVHYHFSLTLFDTAIENRYVAIDLDKVQDLDNRNYQPGGNTALLDAIGTTIKRVEEDHDGADKIVTVIMTDGEENASRQYSTAQIRQMIQEKETLGNWTFVFLGAGLDAFSQGQNLGVQMGNVAKYDADQVRGTYSAMACATNSLSADTLMRSDHSMLDRAPQRMVKSANMERPGGRTSRDTPAIPRR